MPCVPPPVGPPLDDHPLTVYTHVKIIKKSIKKSPISIARAEPRPRSVGPVGRRTPGAPRRDSTRLDPTEVARSRVLSRRHNRTRSKIMSAVTQASAQVAKTVAVSTGKVSNAKSMMVWRPHGNKYVSTRDRSRAKED